MIFCKKKWCTMLVLFLVVVATSPSQAQALSARVPIVMYHHIRPITSDMSPMAQGLSVTPEVFDEQLRFFKEHGYSSVTLQELHSSLTKKINLPPKPIIITFDDGYRDAAVHAFPLLKKYGFRASIFIITDKVGKKPYLTWDQIREMESSGVFEIGSHTLDHPELPTLAFQKMDMEIEKSKKILEAQLNKPVQFFAYPYGKYSKETIASVRKAGYKGAVTTAYGFIHESSSVFELTRVRLSNNDTWQRLSRKPFFK